ncbi:unnamed protein product [Trichogramma brassicae]|uniref:Uncharacterized protein n=1 Tax=Trichogramma brassicae TaxID=86971 RepID=A0A6H5HXR1_9HYME|nr:unnamed protein product [Trichogramma brassicae]
MARHGGPASQQKGGRGKRVRRMRGQGKQNSKGHKDQAAAGSGGIQGLFGLIGYATRGALSWYEQSAGAEIPPRGGKIECKAWEKIYERNEGQLEHACRHAWLRGYAQVYARGCYGHATRKSMQTGKEETTTTRTDTYVTHDRECIYHWRCDAQCGIMSKPVQAIAFADRAVLGRMPNWLTAASRSVHIRAHGSMLHQRLQQRHRIHFLRMIRNSDSLNDHSRGF